MRALYVRCALSVLQKECRKVWGASYMLGARYRLENTVYCNMNLLELAANIQDRASTLACL